MVTYRLKGLELFDALSNFILARGGRIMNPRCGSELHFELPAAKADDIRADIELLGYAPQFVNHDLRLNSSELMKVAVYCLPLNTLSPPVVAPSDDGATTKE
jgi:hypothetical protein